ncbi:MAG: hypothetical protein ACHQIG_03070 [Acidimicrobiia bacterium]
MVVWPAGGRMLSAPLVIGGSVVGDGSLEMVGDTITSATASFDDAPPELSLRLFTFVPNPGGGFSAVLRFRTPIVVLHSWRGHAVRQSMTVVVRPPSGAAQAVQIQPDGTAMNGSFSSGRFQAVAPGNAAIAGNVVVFDVPSSFGASPASTVQAIVEVQADEPLHRNRPATGYAAGTSIVPIGLLTGTGSPPSQLGVADATTALTSTTSVPTVAVGLRPQGIRLEGTGKKLTAVVTLDSSPSKLSATDHPHLDIDVAPPGYATLDHPMRVTWLPGGSPSATSAQVVVDNVVVGDVPVKVSGNKVAFALGAETARKNGAAPATPRLDQLTGQVTLPLGLDEAVSSLDGARETTPQHPDSAKFTVNGPRVTVTPASTGVTATGLVDVAGHFVATNDSEMYTGTIDEEGNVVIYRTTVTTSGGVQQSTAGSRPASVEHSAILVGDPVMVSATRSVHESSAIPAAASPIQISNDGDWNLSTIIKLIYIKYQQDLEDYKEALKWYESGGKNSPYETRPEKPSTPFVFLGSTDIAGAFAASSGDAQPGAAQAGNPDWPATPGLDTPADSSGTFVVRVSAGTVPQGNPIGVTTAWAESTQLAKSNSTTRH